jgi:hypothetical protein
MKIAYDISQMKVGCAIVQAALGGDTMAADYFDTEDWVMTPTRGMRLYDLSPEQIPELVDKTKAARAKVEA